MIPPCPGDCLISSFVFGEGARCRSKQWKYAIIVVLYNRKDREECGIYKGISLVAHAGKILLKVIPRHFSEYCDRVSILPEENNGFRPNRCTTGMMFMIRRLEELARKKQTWLYVCLIGLTIAYDSVERTLLWTELARFDGMRAWARLDDRVCSGWFAVEQRRCQGCVLATLLFNIFFAALINVAPTQFKIDKDIMNALIHLRGKEGAGGRGEETARTSVLAKLVWGILYADDAGIASKSLEQLRKTMGVIVVVCVAFGLAVSKTNTETICLRTQGMRSSPPP